MQNTFTAYIGLGSNLGDRKEQLLTAIAKIEARIGRVTGQSQIYVSPPWGFEAQTDFYNAVIRVETSIEALPLLHILRQIEEEGGRTRNSADGYASRTLDLDVIDFDGRVSADAELQLPHPLMHLRKFVLLPLSEINPGWIHPVLKRPVNDLLGGLQTPDKIRPLDKPIS